MSKSQKPAFKQTQTSEVLADEVVARSPADLVVALIAMSLVFGPARVAAAVRNTYTPADAAKIISGINYALAMERVK